MPRCSAVQASAPASHSLTGSRMAATASAASTRTRRATRAFMATIIAESRAYPRCDRDSLPVQRSSASVVRMRVWPLLLITALAATAPAHAFRCGTRLVHEGDTRSQVIAKCGEPAETIEQQPVFRRPVIWIRGRPFHLGPDFVEVAVESWIYNLGPNK